MNLGAFRSLLTPAGQEALQAAAVLQPREADFLTHFQTLQRSYPDEPARAALEIAILRGEAGAKFPFAEKMYFTREALEQASAWQVATYRAERYRLFDLALDLGCSVGGDTLALAGAAVTLGIDLDPLRLLMARANLAALGLEMRAALLQADLSQELPLSRLPGKVGMFFDPARRAGGRRVYSVRAYQPPLEIIRQWLIGTPALGVKISPGVRLDELSGYEAEVEFISLAGELKEAVLWFGPLRGPTRRATVLPGPHSMTGSGERLPPLLSEPGAWLYEPDPAILRAGLVRTLGQQLGAAQLDPDIAYLTAAEWQPTPFARAWQVEDWFPFGLKRLREYLRVRGVGRLTVKKRGSPLQPEALIRELRLQGEAERTLFLTHLRGRPVAIVAMPYEGVSP